VTILARDVAAAGELARACRARAAVSGGRITFAAGPLAEASAILERLRPAVLLCCVSEQSPYERVTGPSAWTALVAEAGFGITLPFQATIAARLARAIDRVTPETLFVNGAFPDVVNPLLAVLGLPVLCGIGNVATLDACLRAELGPAIPGRLAVLGHHVHLSGPTGKHHTHPAEANDEHHVRLGQVAGEAEADDRDATDEVRAWVDGRPLTGVTARLAGYRALPRAELNAIAGHAAARLVLDLVAGVKIRTSVPGPLGLPGGYPVTIADGSAELDLPPGLTRDGAVSWNLRVGSADGVSIVAGHVRYLPIAAKALADHLPHRADGWAPTELDQVSREFAETRQRLRRMPPMPVTPAGLA
jgi:hypothetical protein